MNPAFNSGFDEFKFSGLLIWAPARLVNKREANKASVKTEILYNCVNVHAKPGVRELLREPFCMIFPLLLKHQKCPARALASGGLRGVAVGT